MNIVDSTAFTFQAFFAKFARVQKYRVAGGDSDVDVMGFVRGLREEDLFAEALQQDSVMIVDAAAFVAATGKDTPRRLDRVTTAANSKFTVEAWRGAPNDGVPTFFKMLLRGGQQ